MDRCAVQVIRSGLIICESNGSACLCENLDNSFKLQPEPVSMVQFIFSEKLFCGYLVNQLLYFFRCYCKYTKVEKKKAHPCCECSKIRKTSPQHMLCAVINKLVYPGLSLYILANERETLFCCLQHVSYQFDCGG